MYSKMIAEAKKNAPLMNGLGLTMEGTEQSYIMFELVLDMTWRQEEFLIDDWVDEYTVYRYGKPDFGAKTAWRLIQNSAFNAPVSDQLVRTFSDRTKTNIEYLRQYISHGTIICIQ
jgi:hypothetical protein